MSSAAGTWTVSLTALTKCQQVIEDGGTALEAVTEGISVVEADHESGVYVVGCGGFPNAAGVLQCDAAVMEGSQCRFGAVLSLESVATPILVARRVLEKSPPCILVGDGARSFAHKEGFSLVDNTELLGEAAVKEWEMWRKNKKVETRAGHDTLGLVARDKQGHFVAAVSTSGAAYKFPGRVGDSPLPGGGLYADNHHGAAVCTGDGDVLLRFCPTKEAVNLMSSGYSPQDACQKVVADISSRAGSLEMGILAMDKSGKVGAAGTVTSWTDPLTKEVSKGFPYSVWHEGMVPAIHVVPPT